jgi:hypothetical protein
LFGHEKSCWTSWAIVVNIVYRHSSHTNLIQSSLPTCWISWNSNTLYSYCNKIKPLPMSIFRQNQTEFQSFQWCIFSCMWTFLYWAFFCCFKRMCKQSCAKFCWWSYTNNTHITELSHLSTAQRQCHSWEVTLWQPRFDPRPGHVGFLGQSGTRAGFLWVLQFSFQQPSIQKFYSKPSTQLSSI